METKSNIQQTALRQVVPNVKRDDTFGAVADQGFREGRPESADYPLITHQNDGVVIRHAIAEIPMRIVEEPLNTSMKALSSIPQRAEN